ncbi:MAG: hypothetical protein Q9168_003087 [Polycauliona sp. 1 TL-2023]
MERLTWFSDCLLECRPQADPNLAIWNDYLRCLASDDFTPSHRVFLITRAFVHVLKSTPPHNHSLVVDSAFNCIVQNADKDSLTCIRQIKAFTKAVHHAPDLEVKAREHACLRTVHLYDNPQWRPRILEWNRSCPSGQRSFAENLDNIQTTLGPIPLGEPSPWGNYTLGADPDSSQTDVRHLASAGPTSSGLSVPSKLADNELASHQLHTSVRTGIEWSQECIRNPRLYAFDGRSATFDTPTGGNFTATECKKTSNQSDTSSEWIPTPTTSVADSYFVDSNDGGMDIKSEVSSEWIPAPGTSAADGYYGTWAAAEAKE